jgi:hypothetical protein
MQPQTRVRKMRPAGRRTGRKADGIRQVYYDPAIRAARGTVRIPATENEQEDQS